MAMFTRRHYQFIAESINKMGGEEFREQVAKHLAEDFAQDNERFDRQKFLNAAVPNEKDSR